MERHLIIIDLDGTLMLDFSHYDQETIDYLNKLTRDGHIIMIATGRPLRSSFFVYQAIGLNSPIINYNGALVKHPFDDKFPKTDLRVEREDLVKIFNFANGKMINVFGEIHDDIYVLDYNEKIHDFLHVDGGVLHEGPLQETLPENPNGCLMFVNSDFVEDLQAYVKANFSDRLHSRYWSVGDYHVVEIYNIAVNKGAGFKQAIEYYNIDPKNTIAIGDGHNDIEMFDIANTSVAMKNSHKDLFSHATTVTDSVDNQGVLKFLKSYFEK